jgi:hypothetical protein
VDPIPDPLLLRKSGSAGNKTWATGSVVRNSDHETTEVSAIEVLSRRMLYLSQPFVKLSSNSLQGDQAKNGNGPTITITYVCWYVCLITTYIYLLVESTLSSARPFV